MSMTGLDWSDVRIFVKSCQVFIYFFDQNRDLFDVAPGELHHVVISPYTCIDKYKFCTHPHGCVWFSE